MVLDKALLLKGLAGVAAVGTVGGVGITYKEEIGNLFKSKEQLEQEKKDGERKRVNGRLGSLGLGDDCRLGEEEDPFVIVNKECGLDEGKLKAINFSNKGEKELIVKPSADTFPANLKIKVERKKEEDISFSFTGLTSGSDIKVFGDKGKIVIKNEEQKFKEEGGRLTKSGNVDQTLKGFNDQLEKVNAPVECRFDESEADTTVECGVTQDLIKKMVFSNKGEEDLKVVGAVADGLKLKVEKNQQNVMSLSFPQQSSELKLFGDKGKVVVKDDKKFNVKDGKLTKESATVDQTLKGFNDQLSKVKAPVECRFDDTDSTEATVECGVTADDIKKMLFSNKGEKELKVKDWPSGTVKLKVEKKTTPSSAISLFLTGITSGSDIKVFGDKGKIVIKSSPETKFKVEEGKLTRESPGKVDEDLKKFNEKLGKINAPVECRFDDTDATETTVKCDVTKEELKTMKFSDGEGELTYSSGQDFSGMKLEVKVETVKDASSTDRKVFYLTFKDFSETVKLANDKDVVSFVKGTNPEFVKEEENFLERMWDTNSFKKLLNLSCAEGVEGNPGKCDFIESSESVTVNVKNTSGNDFSAVDVDDPSSYSFEFHKDQETFNQGYKFVFKGSSSLSSSSGLATLENDKEYEFKWKVQDKVRVGYLVKKSKE